MSKHPLAREHVIWHVHVRSHQVVRDNAGRDVYDVPGREFDIGAMSEVGAKRQALFWAQSDAGVPPWLPYRRQGWKYVKATKKVAGVVG